MPLHKFGQSDVLYNRIKAHPSCSFFIYDAEIYYNNRADEPGKFASNVANAPTGHVNLFELNVDRSAATETKHIGFATGSDGVLDTGLIYPWVYKGGKHVAFKNITRNDYVFNFQHGDVITGSYQISASITRQFYGDGHYFNGAGGTNFTGSALKNSLNYAKRLGPHYDISSGSDDRTNLIQIPSIFYGTEIKKGTVDLKYYITGTLVGRLRDTRQNGALIQSEGSLSFANDDKIAGVVLYKEGFIVLTGSWDLATEFKGWAASPKLEDRDVDGTNFATNATWINFGMGAQDKVTGSAPAGDPAMVNASASFSLEFAGTHNVPVVTMMAHANKGELNYTNNPTYISASQNYTPISGGYYYIEPELEIKNVHSSSYADPTGSLNKTTYITKVGIYDQRKKLIGIASVAKPVKKTEDRDLTFKLKLDI